MALPVRRRLYRRQEAFALYTQLFAHKRESETAWWQIISHYAAEIGDRWQRGAESPEATARRIMGDSLWGDLTKYNPPPKSVTEVDWDRREF